LLRTNVTIHRSAWKGRSAKLDFRFTAFYEVRNAKLRLCNSIDTHMRDVPTTGIR